MYDFEKYETKLNIGRSFKLFYPYMNDRMGKVCIVREVDENGLYKPGIIDIFALKNHSVTTEIKGFKFSDRVFTDEELKNSKWYDDGFFVFNTYIKENYDTIIPDELGRYTFCLSVYGYYWFEYDNLVFVIYQKHRRTQHRCFDKYIDYKKLNYGYMGTIHGHPSDSSCPLCLGRDFDMDYPEYKKLNEIHKFL